MLINSEINANTEKMNDILPEINKRIDEIFKVYDKFKVDENLLFNKKIKFIEDDLIDITKNLKLIKFVEKLFDQVSYELDSIKIKKMIK